MNIPPAVQWLYPNGTVVEKSTERITVGERETNGRYTTLTLTFSPVLTTDGGEYTCVTSVDVPWMETQPPHIDASVHMPVTSEQKHNLNLNSNFGRFFVLFM